MVFVPHFHVFDSGESFLDILYFCLFCPQLLSERAHFVFVLLGKLCHFLIELLFLLGGLQLGFLRSRSVLVLEEVFNLCLFAGDFFHELLDDIVVLLDRYHIQITIITSLVLTT